MRISTSEEYLFVVDSEEYAGNWEREMCAYVTGQIGECEVGEELAARAVEEMSPELREWCEDHVFGKPDDHGCHRPVSLHATPGWFNCGQGNFHREGTDEAIVREKHEKAVQKYGDHIRQIYAHMPEYGENEVRSYIDRNPEPGHYAAFLSIEIYLAERPPDNLLVEMAERVRYFAQEYWEGGKVQGGMSDFRKGPIPVTTVRLVKEITTVEEEDLITL